MKSIGICSISLLTITACDRGVKITTARNPQISLKAPTELIDKKSLFAIPIFVNGIEYDAQSGIFALDITALETKGAEVQLKCDSGCPADTKVEKDAVSTVFSWTWKKETAGASFVISATDGKVTSKKTLKFSVPIYGKCDTDGQTGCITSKDFKPVNLTNLSAGNIKLGVTLGGVAGLYPSALYPLPGASGTDLPSLVADVTAGSYQWWKQDGSRVTGTISDAGTVTPGATTQAFNTSVYKQFTVATDTNLVAGNIKTGVTVFGVAGSVQIKPSDCGGNAQSGCVTTSTFQSADLSNLTPNNIKNGLTIAGIAGLYPSILYPLPSASGTDLPNLAANIAAGTYQWWKQDGTRITGTISDAGTVTPSATTQAFNTSVYKQFTVATDANLAAGNIKTGVTVFGVAGSVLVKPSDCSANAEISCVSTSTYKAADLTNLAAANIKTGVTIAGTAGNVIAAPATCNTDGQLNCVTEANFPALAKSVLNGGWNLRAGITAGGVAGGIKYCRNTINTSIFGTTGDKYSTINNYNNNLSGLPPGIVTGWANYRCGANNWQDVSSSGAACNNGNGVASDDVCMQRDNITGLTWSPVQNAANWNTAKTTCDGLTHGGVLAGTWRLPTQLELLQAGIDGITALDNPNFITKAQMYSGLWGSTTRSQDTTTAYAIDITSVYADIYTKTNTSPLFMCVRE